MYHQKKKNIFFEKIFKYLKIIVRIFFLLLFIHWITQFTTYPRYQNYSVAIKDIEDLYVNERPVRNHICNYSNWKGRYGGMLNGTLEMDARTKEYQVSGFFSRNCQRSYTVGEIEKDILYAIAKKKNKSDIKKWYEEKSVWYNREIKDVFGNCGGDKHNDNKIYNKEEYAEFDKIIKKITINIENILIEENLKIKDLSETKFFIDPFSFFLINPLDKLTNLFFSNETIIFIFKFLSLKFFIWCFYYPKKTNINYEIFCNFILSCIENIIFFFHPCFFDRTNKFYLGNFQRGIWNLSIFIILLLSLILDLINDFFYENNEFIKIEDLNDFFIQKEENSKKFFSKIISNSFFLYFFVTNYGNCLLHFLNIFFDFFFGLIICIKNYKKNNIN